MMDEGEVRRILVESLGKEGGEATLDRLLYAYQALRSLDRGELLKIAEGCEEMEVVKRRYRPWDDRDVVVILRLRGFEGKSDPTHISGDVDLDEPRALIRCRSCG